MLVEPYGPRQDDLRAGVVASWVAATGGAHVPPADMFPSLKAPAVPRLPPAPDAWKRVLAMVKALTISEGGTVAHPETV